jgi:hypothetical protein
MVGDEETVVCVVAGEEVGIWVGGAVVLVGRGVNGGVEGTGEVSCVRVGVGSWNLRVKGRMGTTTSPKSWGGVGMTCGVPWAAGFTAGGFVRGETPEVTDGRNAFVFDALFAFIVRAATAVTEITISIKKRGTAYFIFYTGLDRFR